MQHKHGGTFTSSMGAILAAVGSAVGMGNIWLFPYRVGQYGGGAFLIPYFLFVALFSYVGLSGEFAFGRLTGTGARGSFDYALKTRGLRGGAALGVLPLLGVLGIAIGYSVVVGWVLNYAVGSLTGAVLAGDPDGYFSALAVSFGSVPWHLLVIAATVLILILGVAGGIGEGVHIGDVVIATACVEYDFDTSAVDQWPAGQLTLPGQEEPVRFLPCEEGLAKALAAAGEDLYGRAHLGVVATGDKFVADPAVGEWLQKEFGALACEMEGGAIAHACLVNQVPCAVLRTISDNAHDSETVDFMTFAQGSAQKAQELLRKVLPRL